MPKDGSGLSVDGFGLPLWLVAELTYKCPLKCPWCSNPVDFDSYEDELTTEEWKRVLSECRKLGSVQLGFTGGEPLARRDLEELVAEGDRLGYYTNLITSGMGLTSQRLQRLKEAGLKQIQLSIQSCDEDLTDHLVGAKAFSKKISAAKEMKSLGFPVVLNVPVSRYNIDKTEAILDMAEEIGVDYVEFANLQYYNWALLNRSELLPTRDQISRAEAAVRKARARLDGRMTVYFVVPDYYEGRPKACMNGWGTILLTVAPDGTALPCQEARAIEALEFPNVRDHDIGWIWRDSPGFRAYRGDGWMKEPCRSCDDREKDFGGCRCQAFILTGDAANTDPACSRSPHHHLIREAVAGVRAEWPQRPLIMRQRNTNPA